MKTTHLLIVQIVTALLLVSGTASCRVVTKKHPVDRVVLAQNERDLWNSMRVAINAEDYPVGAAGANPAKREIITGWKRTMAPFRRNSWRKRVIVKFAPFAGSVEEAKAALGAQMIDPDLEVFDVSIRVQKDDNKSLRAIHEKYADWTPADDDLASAQKLMQSLISYLGTEQFRLSDPEKLPYDLD